MSTVYVVSSTFECYECGGESEPLFVAKSKERAEAKIAALEAEDAKHREAHNDLAKVQMQLHIEHPEPKAPVYPYDPDVYRAWYEELKPVQALHCKINNEQAKAIAVVRGVEPKMTNEWLSFYVEYGAYVIKEVECED